jgi:ABC-type multidrug transport system fused ATPase/permease subunit
MMAFAWKHSVGYRWALIAAYVCSAMEAGVAPSFAVIAVRLGDVILTDPYDKDAINGWIGGMMLLGVLGSVISYLRQLFINIYGTHLTMTLRAHFFEKILSRSAAWVDAREGQQGGLHAKIFSPTA